MDEKHRGPSTQAGRKKASRNALAHGILSTKPVIPGMERESDWRRYRDGILASLDPEGDLEHALAERVALLLWRLRRVARFEIVAATQDLEGTESGPASVLARLFSGHELTKDLLPEPAPAAVVPAQPTRLLPAPDKINTIIRYETHLHRQCLQTLHEIEALQARRRGEQTPLARLDISAPPLT